jgi:hypothetical protein
MRRSILVGFLTVLVGAPCHSADDAWEYSSTVDEFTDEVSHFTVTRINERNVQSHVAIGCQNGENIFISFSIGEPIEWYEQFIFIGVALYARVEVRVDSNPMRELRIPIRESRIDMANLVLSAGDIDQLRHGESISTLEFANQTAINFMELVPEMIAGNSIRWLILGAHSGPVSKQASLIGFTNASRQVLSACRFEPLDT